MSATTDIRHPSSFRRHALQLVVVALTCTASSALADDVTPPTGPINAIRVGIASHYKVGFWTPVSVDVQGAALLNQPKVEVMVPDSDGVQTVASGELHLATTAGADRTAVVDTKVGRRNSPIQVVLLDGEIRLDDRTLRPGIESESTGQLVEMPATSELIVVLSSRPFDLQQVYKEQPSAGSEIMKRSIAISAAEELPDHWLGYDAVDVLVMSIDDGPLWRELAADSERLAAIEEWVELGGRLVLMCGGEQAEAAFGGGSGLATLLPGKFADVVRRLPDTGRLEQYANSEASIGAGGVRATISVPRLTDVEGNIEVYVGQRPSDLPLVVRSPRELGEIAFVGLDFAKPPLANWPGRTAFLQAVLRPYVASDGDRSDSQTLVTRGYNDLSGALRQSLGRSFAGLSPVTFSGVTLLALAYLLVLGPIDYFVIHRWLGRPIMAWVTFPLFVLLFTGAALALTDWRRGDGGVRVNRREVIDVDVLSGRTRGSYWATLYAPRAARLNLKFESATISNEVAATSQLSAWGLPGVGIGGMQSGGLDLGIVRNEYRYVDDLSGLEGVPVLTSSTKSFNAGWQTIVTPPLAATLTDVDGLVEGTIENHTGERLLNVLLFYNGWGYQLGNVDDGEQVTVNDELSPLRVKTIVTRSAIGRAAAREDESFVFRPEDVGADGLLNLIMFYEAAGGQAFVQLPNRYQADVDLSRLLDLGRAVVVANVEGGGSRLLDTDSGDELGKADSAEVIYRFVLPVRN